MTNISSQDFRNVYEKLYAEIRNYLWSYDTLKDLAQLEQDIYSAFIDRESLERDFYKLKSSIKEVLDEDELLKKQMDALEELIELEDSQLYARLPGVAEVNPGNNKVIRTIPEEEQEA